MAEPVNLQPTTVHHDAIRVALDCLEEGFQIIGRDWRYVYVNPAAARHGRFHYFGQTSVNSRLAGG